MLCIVVMMTASKSYSVEAPTNNLGAQLKSAVVESRKQLGQLPQWQARLFDEEVVPQYQRFIKDYRTASAGGIKAEVDFENLRNFLRYQAPGSNVLVYLSADPTCIPCKASQPAIQSLVKNRLERRGLVPVWIAAEDIGEPQLKGKALHEKIFDIAQTRNAAAALVVNWQTAPKEGIDAAYASEQRYLVTSYLNVRGVAKAEGRTELLSADEMESTAGHLLTDAFTEMGAKLALAQATSSDPTKDEMTLSLSGIRDFTQYSDLRQKLEERLKAIATLEERRISRGRVVFAVMTEKSAQEVWARLNGFEAEVEVQ